MLRTPALYPTLHWSGDAGEVSYVFGLFHLWVQHSYEDCRTKSTINSNNCLRKHLIFFHQWCFPPPFFVFWSFVFNHFLGFLSGWGNCKLLMFGNIIRKYEMPASALQLIQVHANHRDIHTMHNWYIHYIKLCCMPWMWLENSYGTTSIISFPGRFVHEPILASPPMRFRQRDCC